MSTEKQTDLIKPEPVRSETMVALPTGEPSANQMLSTVIQQMTPENAAAMTTALEKLVDLKERLDAKDAEKAFNCAFAEFKKRCPQIPKNRDSKETSRDTGTKFTFKYADWTQISTHIDPILRDVGLTYDFDSDYDATTQIFTFICRLRHIGGHHIESKFSVPLDEKAYMGLIQKYGNSRTYGTRYAVENVLGLVTCEDDNDGATPESMETLDENQQANLIALLEEVGRGSAKDKANFAKWLKADKIADIRQGDYDRAVDYLEGERKKQ